MIFASKGNFGDVAKGLYDDDSGRPAYLVALKTLKEVRLRLECHCCYCRTPVLTQLQGLTHDREELLREAAIMAQFVHANVIRLVGVVTVGEPLMIVLEYAGKLQHPT